MHTVALLLEARLPCTRQTGTLAAASIAEDICQASVAEIAMLSVRPVTPGNTAQPSWQTCTGGWTMPQPITLPCRLTLTHTQQAILHAAVVLCSSRCKHCACRGVPSNRCSDTGPLPWNLMTTVICDSACACKSHKAQQTPSSLASDGAHDAGGHRCGSPAAHLCLGRKLLPGLRGRGSTVKHAPAAGPAAFGGLACPQLLCHRAPGIASTSAQWIHQASWDLVLGMQTCTETMSML